MFYKNQNDGHRRSFGCGKPVFQILFCALVKHILEMYTAYLKLYHHDALCLLFVIESIY